MRSIFIVPSVGYITQKNCGATETIVLEDWYRAIGEVILFLLGLAALFGIG